MKPLDTPRYTWIHLDTKKKKIDELDCFHIVFRTTQVLLLILVNFPEFLAHYFNSYSEIMVFGSSFIDIYIKRCETKKKKKQKKNIRYISVQTMLFIVEYFLSQKRLSVL